jgi:hypothetical protein
MREAIAWLKKSETTNDIDLIWRDVDPLLKDLKHALIHQVPEFAAAEEERFTHIL